MAQEIGKLAGQTAEAVRETAGVLHRIEADVAGVVTSINASLDSSAAAAVLLQEIGKVFDRGLGLVGQVNVRVKETFDGVNARLQELSAVLAGQTRDLESVTNAGRLMTGLSGNLERLVEEYPLAYEIDGGVRERVRGLQDSLLRLAENPGLSSLDPNAHQGALAALKEEKDAIEAVWSNDAQGNFIVSYPPAGLANAGVREWWQRAMAGDEYVSPVYISAITRRPCLTVAVPIRGEGRVGGVIGADLGLG